MQEVLSVWAAYACAMRAEPDPASPFASPRSPHTDAELMWTVAEDLGSLGPGSSSTSSSASDLGSGSGRAGLPAAEPSACSASGDWALAERARGSTGVASGAGGALAVQQGQVGVPPLSADSVAAAPARQPWSVRRFGVVRRLFRTAA